MNIKNFVLGQIYSYAGVQIKICISRTIRIPKFLLLLLVIFISCEELDTLTLSGDNKEEVEIKPPPGLNGSFIGYVRIPPLDTLCRDTLSINGLCGLTLEDNKYYLQINASLDHYNPQLNRVTFI